jgi:hypothetical protein
MSAIKFRLRSKAFRRGLVDGFGAPFFFFTPSCGYAVPDPDDTLRDAWDDVSRAIAESYRVERIHIGESGKTKSASKTRERCSLAAN